MDLLNNEHHHHRQKRQNNDAFANLERTSDGGTRGTVGATSMLFKDSAGRHLDASAQVAKTFRPNNPVEYNGGLNYVAPRGGASVDVGHARGFGTNLNVEGRGLLYQSRDRLSRLDGNVNYNQQFGGGQHARPNFGGGLTFTRRFG